MIPQPDPPLRSGELVLRPWRVDDAPALIAAWADDEIHRWAAVPPVRDLAYAERWIAGWEDRRELGLSLDLAVERHGRVAGEIGLFDWRPPEGTIEIGWWTAAADRGHGVASAAARLVVEWASATMGVAVHATCDPANPASLAVARAAGAIVVSGDAPT